MNSLLGENSYGARAGAIYSANVCFYIVISLIISLIIQGAGLTGDVAAYLGYFASPIAICITLALSSKYLKTPLRAAAPIKCAPKYYLIAILAVFGLLFAISPLNSIFFWTNHRKIGYDIEVCRQICIRLYSRLFRQISDFIFTT